MGERKPNFGECQWCHNVAEVVNFVPWIETTERKRKAEDGQIEVRFYRKKRTMQLKLCYDCNTKQLDRVGRLTSR